MSLNLIDINLELGLNIIDWAVTCFSYESYRRDQN